MQLSVSASDVTLDDSVVEGVSVRGSELSNNLARGLATQGRQQKGHTVTRTVFSGTSSSSTSVAWPQ